MNIHEILKSFRAPLSEEQAWAVCYQCAGELIAKQEESFQHLQPQFIDVSLQTTVIRKDGSIEYTNVCSERPPKKNGDVLFRLGSLIYECLDFGMEVYMERELDPSLEKLILDMTCAESDEGISVPDEFEARISKDCSFSSNRSSEECLKEVNLELVMQRCTDHLTHDIADPSSHFRAVCRALVNEAIELSEFLRQLYNGQALMSQSWGQGTNWAYLQSLHASEWAKLWLQAMRELRQGVTLRHVVHAKLPPASFEMTPFEMLLDDIRYRRFQLNHVTVTSQKKKGDAHDIILDFIRSRPPLSKSTDRKIKPLPKTSPNLHEKLLHEIRKGAMLKHTPQPKIKSAREIYLEEVSPESLEDSPYASPKRKCLKPDLKLAEMIRRWDSPVSDGYPSPTSFGVDIPKMELYDCDESISSETSGYSSGSLKATCIELQRQKESGSPSSESSVELDCIQNVRFRTSYEVLPFDDRPLFPPSLRSLQNMKVTSKIYLTLKEVKHMRKTLAKLELETVDPESSHFYELYSGKLCFCCQRRKFSLFGHWSRKCEICERRVCVYCIHKLEPSISYVFLENEEADRRDSGYCEGYWPSIPTIPTTMSSPSLGASLTDAKTHKVCSSCKRFISMHC